MPTYTQRVQETVKSVSGKLAVTGRHYAVIRFGTKKERDNALPLIQRKLYSSKIKEMGANSLIIDWSD